MKAAHLRSCLIVGSPFLGFVDIGDIRFAAYRHIECLLRQPGLFRCGVLVGSHVVVVVQERIIMLPQTRFGCPRIGFRLAQRLRTVHVRSLELRGPELNAAVGRNSG